MTLGLYVHIPFCATKCGYCDFYSHVPAAGQFEPLVEAVLADLDRSLARTPGRIETLFVGGGTPTLLPAGTLARLFDRLGQIAREHAAVEFTVEANPASLTETKARVLKDHGVTRVSMGAQSFHAHELKVLDRIHHPGDIAPSAEIIHRVCFDHFNLDLIFGIPGQTADTWLESLTKAIALGPDHLACYGLTIEPGTALHDRWQQGTFASMDEEAELDLYELTLERLRRAGFERYEISNYAQPGAQCRHNLRYWHNLPGLGIGPSAASYIDGRRWRNVPDTMDYVKRIQAGNDATIDHEQLSPTARAGETAMLALRTIEGIDRTRFREATGFDLDTLFGETITRHVNDSLLDDDGHRVALTPKGLRIADTLMADFLLPDPENARTLHVIE